MSWGGTYEQSQRFNAAALVRPRRRRETTNGPAPIYPAYLSVIEDPARGRALIRGLNARNVLEAAAVRERARWSVGSLGYVITMADLPDVVAMAQYSNVPVHIKRIEDS